MRKTQTLLLCFLFASGIAVAEKPSEQTIQLAEQGVTGTNANGQSQTTFVDEGGNLKMAPSTESKGSENRPQPKQSDGGSGVGMGAMEPPANDSSH